jgi:tetratricopeptide (TPR) repeat protein
VETVAQTEVQADASESVEPVKETESQPVVEVVAEVTSDTAVVIEETAPVSEVPAEAQPTLENPADAQTNESIIQEIIALTVDGKSGEAAYEEFLQDASQPELVQEEPAQEAANHQETVEPVAMKNEVRVELDTKNAHVWNELGNVYFNSGAYEEAITAYGKAIELDGWFAWPYSNLALAYVQKEKYAEAVLLYQRSIELFSSDKDKAVTWNRLGNVYRRLNDYENAISSYQRADELDPNNTTRSLRSSFSLLGSFNTEPSPSFAS